MSQPPGGACGVRAVDSGDDIHPGLELERLRVHVQCGGLVAEVALTLHYRCAASCPLGQLYLLRLPLAQTCLVTDANASFGPEEDAGGSAHALRAKLVPREQMYKASGAGDPVVLYEVYEADVFKMALPAPVPHKVFTVHVMYTCLMDTRGTMAALRLPPLNPRPDDRVVALSGSIELSGCHGNPRLRAHEILGNWLESGTDIGVSQTDVDIEMDFTLNYPAVYSLLVEKGQHDNSHTEGCMEEDLAFFSLLPPAATDSAPAGEFIFMVDTSGSMRSGPDGGAISHAKDTLMLFLKSIPVGCYFNVVSFASSYAMLFPSGSRRYSADTLEQAVAFQGSMVAGGGTQLLGPLRATLGKPPVPGHPRYVFVLTDGVVSDRIGCIGVVKEHKESRVCAYGIGPGADRALVRGLAEAGRGLCEFVTGASRSIETQVMGAVQTMVMGGTVEWQLPAGMTLAAHGEFPAPMGGMRTYWAQLRGKPKGRKGARDVAVTWGRGGGSCRYTSDLESATVDSERRPLHTLWGWEHTRPAAAALTDAYTLGQRERQRATAVCAAHGVVRPCFMTVVTRGAGPGAPDVAVFNERSTPGGVLTPFSGLQATVRTEVCTTLQPAPSTPVPAAPLLAPPHAAPPAPAAPLPSVRAGRRGPGRGCNSSLQRALNKSALRKLGYRGGTVRMSSLVHEELRHTFRDFFLAKIIKDAVLYAENGKRKTVNKEDVNHALVKNGIKLFGIEEHTDCLGPARPRTKRRARPQVMRSTPLGKPEATSSIADVLGVRGLQGAGSKGRTQSTPAAAGRRARQGGSKAVKKTPSKSPAKAPARAPAKTPVEAPAKAHVKAPGKAPRKPGLTKQGTEPVVEASVGRGSRKRSLAATASSSSSSSSSKKRKQVAFQLPETLSRTRSQRQDGVTGGPVKDFTAMVGVISLQNFDGSWDLSRELAQHLGSTVDALTRASPDKNLKTWATALALAWLTAHFWEQNTEWGMVSFKGDRFLGDTVQLDESRQRLMAAARSTV